MCRFRGTVQAAVRVRVRGGPAEDQGVEERSRETEEEAPRTHVGPRRDCGPPSGPGPEVVFCVLGNIEDDALPGRTHNGPIPYLLTPSVWLQGERGGVKGEE